jgi:hypothetical protein
VFGRSHGEPRRIATVSNKLLAISKAGRYFCVITRTQKTSSHLPCRQKPEPVVGQVNLMYQTFLRPTIGLRASLFFHYASLNP